MWPPPGLVSWARPGGTNPTQAQHWHFLTQWPGQGGVYVLLLVPFAVFHNKRNESNSYFIKEYSNTERSTTKRTHFHPPTLVLLPRADTTNSFLLRPCWKTSAPHKSMCTNPLNTDAGHAALHLSSPHLLVQKSFLRSKYRWIRKQISPKSMVRNAPPVY